MEQKEKKTTIVLLLIALLIVGGYYVYKYLKKTGKLPTNNNKEDNKEKEKEEKDNSNGNGNGNGDGEGGNNNDTGNGTGNNNNNDDDDCGDGIKDDCDNKEKDNENKEEEDTGGNGLDNEPTFGATIPQHTDEWVNADRHENFHLLNEELIKLYFGAYERDPYENVFSVKRRQVLVTASSTNDTNTHQWAMYSDKASGDGKVDFTVRVSGGTYASYLNASDFNAQLGKYFFRISSPAEFSYSGTIKFNGVTYAFTGLHADTQIQFNLNENTVWLKTIGGQYLEQLHPI